MHDRVRAPEDATVHATDDTTTEPTAEPAAATLRIGTVDLPPRMTRERYFEELRYLELSALYAGPLKPSALAKLVEDAPSGSIGLVAPFVVGHRTPPKLPRLWPHDATTGDFRDSPLTRDALAQLRDAARAISARYTIFRSPDAFSPSAANRDRLRMFFSELAPREQFGERVWIPGGLWSVRTAAKIASELDLAFSFDPLVRHPGEPAEAYYDLEVSSLYLRIEGAARGSAIRSEKLDELADLVEHYGELPTTVAFASPNRWQDARNFSKLFSAN